MLVRAGQRPRQSDGEWLADQQTLVTAANQSTEDGGLGVLAALMDRLMPTAEAQSSWPDDFAYDETVE